MMKKYALRFKVTKVWNRSESVCSSFSSNLYVRYPDHLFQSFIPILDFVLLTQFFTMILYPNPWSWSFHDPLSDLWFWSFILISFITIRRFKSLPRSFTTIYYINFDNDFLYRSSIWILIPILHKDLCYRSFSNFFFPTWSFQLIHLFHDVATNNIFGMQ